MLDQLITSEELFDICLSLVVFDDDAFNGPAGRIVTFKATLELAEEKESFTEDEIEERIKNMIVSKILENLVKKDLVEVDLSEDETGYRITDKGVDVLISGEEF